MKKERVDVLAFQQGLYETREKAKRGIMAGQVYDQNNLRLDKAGEKISLESILHIKGEKLKYVSRGGLKLEKALTCFDIILDAKIVIDIGASTGGFTDVMLQNGAKLSYAVDVGTNQLAWRLRQDERVIVMEQYNFRYAKLTDFKQGLPEFASIDVSFISLALILPALLPLLTDGGEAIALIKPQFEAGRAQIGKNGIIKDSKVHLSVLEKTIEMILSIGFSIKGLEFSPITGGHGNIEFLAYLKKDGLAELNPAINPAEVVKQAHDNLHQ
ncbi:MULTISPECIES: TlyA family RNA methyltransferase [unclassified Enterococcus]|uniref:TlyA family RNA methyltransferase n=1 Tax=unclassified Enterococcus TaxID=2608891 RepID=UPI001556D532|nr:MULTISPECIES: TlyA family RNA methyltransferase [unclassified Enterococcus]MBS7575989.1 TlyA family RNA methyltransferase [Enterococcus sp. MMGLQ5-2]MBS7583222.1 TlyA family RNA methyltransferase [Enterococcus sp. MMGLQ5-1]NPD11082.1 TlyA family RNA methyltransferase [Enterococcus sp. MMGLQ5-1]NPD35825.1 TlyA family RNA methyltransferase [Enterococcus sp. MMGLQ5-2]